MPVTITVEQAAVAIRATTDAGTIPAPVAMTLGFLFPAAVALVTEYAPAAPNDVLNAAAIRLTGWLYDADPTDPQIGRAMQVSGATALLGRWRVHRAGAVGTVDAEPVPVPAGSGLPPVPDDGTFILSVQNGVLTWLKFPVPPQS